MSFGFRATRLRCQLRASRLRWLCSVPGRLPSSSTWWAAVIGPHIKPQMATYYGDVYIHMCRCIFSSFYRLHILSYFFAVIFIYYPPSRTPSPFPSLCCQVVSQNLRISLLSGAVPKPSHLFAVRCCSIRRPKNPKKIPKNHNF